MSEKAEYQIDGKTYCQYFMTIDEWDEFGDIYNAVKKNPKLKGVGDVVREIKKSGKLLQFLNMILKGDEPITDYNIIKPILLLEIVEDFFCLNELKKATGKIFSMIWDTVQDEKVMAVLQSIPTITKTMKDITTSIGIQSSLQSRTETSANTGSSGKKSVSKQ